MSKKLHSNGNMYIFQNGYPWFAHIQLTNIDITAIISTHIIFAYTRGFFLFNIAIARYFCLIKYTILSLLFYLLTSIGKSSPNFLSYSGGSSLKHPPVGKNVNSPKIIFPNSLYKSTLTIGNSFDNFDA